MRINDELLQIDLLISERFLGLVTRAVEGRLKTWFVMCDAHPTAASTRSRLNHHRITDFLCDFDRLILCLDDSIAARSYRHTGLARKIASSILITHRLHRA